MARDKVRINYGDSAVGYVQLKRDGNICIVQGKVCPEHRVNSKAYVVKILVDEDDKNVIEVQCQDCAASEGGCKHAIAFLMWIHRRSEEPEPTESFCNCAANGEPSSRGGPKPPDAGRASVAECERVGLLYYLRLLAEVARRDFRDRSGKSAEVSSDSEVSPESQDLGIQPAIVRGKKVHMSGVNNMCTLVTSNTRRKTENAVKTPQAKRKRASESGSQ
ncbi:PREDICTED: uncharacterized protein LOC105455110 [Wasmannia auropunctata]|uniref:uncharacterized protein LOC105455110 n=1 Tax=Wasmannia auropunctata TaxID=64793 RepID=UPI0005ED438B|nr:PREDICTED: uncharacterized protein LOC105455110 [Wasmannia auropunctata]